MQRTLIFSSLLALLIFSCEQKKDQVVVSDYPATKKVQQIDTVSGVVVEDPYRWLENDTSTETANWVSAQNEVTSGYLKNIPFRSAIRERLEKLQNYERLSAPHKEGDYIYYSKNSGLQNHNVQYRKKGENGTEEIFLDPNTFSKDGTTAPGGLSYSNDGSLVAFTLHKGGSDLSSAVVLRTADKTLVGDTLRDLKFSGLSWRGNDGFYYCKYDKPKGSQLSAKAEAHKFYYHKLGTDYSADKIVFGDKTQRRYVYGGLSEDERLLIIGAANSTYGNELYVQDLKDPKGKLITVVDNEKNSTNIIDNDGTTLILQTDLDAPNSKIVSVDLSNPGSSNWKTIVPETEEPIQGVGTAGKKLFVNYLKDAKTVIKQYDYSGKLEREVELPGIGSAFGFGGKAGDKEIYYAFTSFTDPTSIFKYDIASGKSTLYNRPKVDFDPDAYETKQVFFASKDGTKIPMFIVHKKGLELNGKNATWLYAYGGFGVSLSPTFSTSRIMWLENGGVYAQPNLRGGGEYGEKWHQAGTKMNKQNVFDDFIAAGDFLIAEKYTSSPYLAIHGGSNGGLLIGATMTQRPDLARVAFPAVGVMDMLRYHKFTSGAGWASDYGTADDSKEMMEYLKKYSPVHALKPGTSYPATMVTTADHDDRVVPAHSYKFAATLQEDQVGDNPVLIRVDTKSGHGASNLNKVLDEAADRYSFAFYNMGITPEMVKKSM